jgi:integrase
MAKRTTNPIRQHHGGFSFRVRTPAGKRLRYSYPTRREAEDSYFRLQLGQAPGKVVAPAPPKPRTFGELCDEWIRLRTSQKRKPKDDVSITKTHLRPALGRTLLSDLTTAHTDALAVTLAHLRPNTRRNILKLARAMLRYAVEIGWIPRAPAVKVPTVHVDDQAYSYLRNDNEVDRLLRAAREEGQAVSQARGFRNLPFDTLLYALYATATYTGLRAGELAGLNWEAVDLNARRITVRRSYEGPTKSGRIRYVPILDVLLPILTDWRRVNPGEIVFPNERLGRLGTSARVFGVMFSRTLARAQFPRCPERGGRGNYIRFHDLRHTFASHFVMRGGSLFDLSKLLGHRDAQTTQRYAHLAPDHFDRVRDLFGPARPVDTTANVIPFPAPVTPRLKEALK